MTTDRDKNNILFGIRHKAKKNKQKLSRRGVIQFWIYSIFKMFERDSLTVLQRDIKHTLTTLHQLIMSKALRNTQVEII